MNKTALKKKFIEIYGNSAEDIRFFAAPGRVNLIGEHVDYCGGICLPAALDYDCAIVARKNGRGEINIAATTTPFTASLRIDSLKDYKKLEFANYQAGVAFVMQTEGYDVVGCDLLYDCRVPFGAGLSSSAAIEVSTALTLSTFSGEEGGRKASAAELALIGKRAENEYCGVNCGIMDQFVSAQGKKDHALLLNCFELSFDYVPTDFYDCSLVITNTNKPHSLASSGYNERRRESEEALSEIRKFYPEIDCLAKADGALVESLKAKLSRVLYKRALHVGSECDRVRAAARALKSGDTAEFGRLLVQSHASLRDLYEVSCRELDILVDAATADEFCLGSRMTGGGFGGCTLSIVKKDGVAEFTDRMEKAYAKAIGYKPTFYLTGIGDGAREIL